MSETPLPPYQGTEVEQIPPTVPIAPPTQAGVIAAHAMLPVWPKVIGIISIVLGAGGVLLNIWSVVAMLMVDTFAEMASQFSPGPQMPAEVWNGGRSGSLVCIYVAMLILAALLLVGGIGLVCRRAWAPKVCVGWALGKIAGGIASVMVTYQMQEAQMKLFANDPNLAATGMSGGPLNLIMLMTMVFMFVWLAAYPLFMLVWLSRRGVKEHIASWR